MSRLVAFADDVDFCDHVVRELAVRLVRGRTGDATSEHSAGSLVAPTSIQTACFTETKSVAPCARGTACTGHGQDSKTTRGRQLLISWVAFAHLLALTCHGRHDLGGIGVSQFRLNVLCKSTLTHENDRKKIGSSFEDFAMQELTATEAKSDYTFVQIVLQTTLVARGDLPAHPAFLAGPRHIGHRAGKRECERNRACGPGPYQGVAFVGAPARPAFPGPVSVTVWPCPPVPPCLQSPAFRRAAR